MQEKNELSFPNVDFLSKSLSNFKDIMFFKFFKHIRIYILFFLSNCLQVFSQEERPITTAFPFLLISPDAIASGRGDIGGASSPDVFSQYWNSSKYVFSLQKSGIGMSYTPYLNKLSRDIFLANLSYYRKGIIESVKVRGGGFDEFAHANTWKKWKTRFMQAFAANLGLY